MSQTVARKSTATADPRVGLLREIHARRREAPALAKDDAAWREQLKAWTSESHLSTMDIPTLRKVAGCLREAGEAVRAAFPYRWSGGLKKARAYWIELGKARVVTDRRDSALAAFVARQTGIALGRLTTAQETQVLTALKDWCRREGMLDERGYADHRLRGMPVP